MRYCWANPNEGFQYPTTYRYFSGTRCWGIKLCTSCVKARGLLDAKLIDGVTLGTLDDVSEWTLWADKF